MNYSDRILDSSLITVLIGVAILSLPGCAPGEADSPRLVLIYAACSVNKDYTSPYDPGVAYTPNLGAFAENARIFDRHHTEAGESGIAYASIYTGGDARLHGVYYHPGWIPDDVEMLSELLAQAGYDTFFWDQHGMASKRFNYAQGVDRSQVFTGILTGRSKPFGEILDRLAAEPTYKAAILHNNSVAHWPYAHPSAVAAFGKRFPDETAGVDWNRIDEIHALFSDHMLALQYNFQESVQHLGLTDEDVEQLIAFIEASYKTQVHSLDELFGSVRSRIVEAGLDGDSLTVFTADHGELLFRPNAPFKWTHSLQLSHEVMNVPLIIGSEKLGIPPGRYGGVTRSIDLLPTVAGLLDLELPPLAGVDLSGAVRGDSPEPELIAHFHTAFSPEEWSEEETAQWAEITLANNLFPGYTPDTIWVGLRSKDMLFKYRTQLESGWILQAFDLDADPFENDDIFDPDNPEHAAMADLLTEYKRALEQAFLDHQEQQTLEQIDEDERLEALKSLGYVR